MATVTSTITLSSASGDLTTNALTLSDSNAMTFLGTAGLARTTTVAASAATILSKTLYRADDATTDAANKVYLKNLSATSTEYFTIHIDQEEMGRLYAGDFAFFPWADTSGTKAAFTVTIAATWAALDTWEFDGVTLVAASSTVGDIADQIHTLNYPNWITTHTEDAATVVFTARYASSASEVVWATADGTLDTAGNGTANISSSTAGTKSEADITIRPSVHTSMSLEHMLLTN